VTLLGEPTVASASDRGAVETAAGTGDPEVPMPYRIEADDCTSCGLCAVLAGDHFAPADLAYVVTRQPADDPEVGRCEDARESCPTDAIRRETAA
jgi:ferredoxin